MFDWLIFYITCCEPESVYFNNIIRPLLKDKYSSYSKNINFDIIFIDKLSRVGKLKNITVINTNNFKISTTKKILSIDEIIDKHISNKKYDGVILATHTDGVTLLPCKSPICEISKFIEICKNHTKNNILKYLIFDCCYMGSLESLYDFSSISEYILATPSYHDGKISYLESPELFEYKNYIKYKLLNKLANWYTTTSNSYSKKLSYAIQWNVYSSEYIKKLFDYIVANNLYEKFVYSKQSIIYYDDDNFHDFVSVIKNTYKKYPELKNKIIRIMRLFFRSYVIGYSSEISDKKKIVRSKMGIYKNIPECYYSDKTVVCKLKSFNTVHCK